MSFFLKDLFRGWGPFTQRVDRTKLEKTSKGPPGLANPSGGAFVHQQSTLLHDTASLATSETSQRRGRRA